MNMRSRRSSSELASAPVLSSSVEHVHSRGGLGVPSLSIYLGTSIERKPLSFNIFFVEESDAVESFRRHHRSSIQAIAEMSPMLLDVIYNNTALLPSFYPAW